MRTGWRSGIPVACHRRSLCKKLRVPHESIPGNGDGVITRALRELDTAASLGGSKTLYDANRETYDRLRHGVEVQPAVGEQTVTVWLIDWDNPGNQRA